MTMTLSEIAVRIAELEKRDAIRVHAQMRNPAIRALLTPIESERGRTTAVKFAPDELIRARIASVLIDIGHDAATIADALAPLARPVRPGFSNEQPTWPESFAVRDESGKVVAYQQNQSGLASVVRGVRQGEAWELRIRFLRDHAGGRQVHAHLALSAWEHDSAADMVPIDQSFGQTHLGDLTIPLAPLIAPLLEELSEGGE